MSKSVYSFGPDSPMKFHIPDALAENYNKAVEQYFKAQQRFNQKFGRQWDPVTDPIAIRWTRRQKKAWNAFGKVMNQVIDAEGPFHENDIMDDFLVKNAVSAASYASGGWGSSITMVAGAGALYGWLRRP